MRYIFTGTLRAHSCGGEIVPVADASLRLYRKQDDQDAPGFAIREHTEIRDREYALIAQGRANADGRFRVDLSEKTVYGHRGSTHPYAGDPFVLDICAQRVEGAQLDHDPEPVQFTVGVVQPRFSEEGGDQVAHWDHEIDAGSWGAVRLALDVWTIHGRVLRSGSGEPLANVKVFAYDSDPLQDDFLGDATTDADGSFRIDFPGAAFRKTPVPGTAYERGGPEVYFRVENHDGTTIYEEKSSRGSRPDRANVTNCFSTDLSVDSAATVS